MTQRFLKILVALTVSVASSAMEASQTQLYSLATLMTHQTKVTVIVAENARKTCEAESHRRKLGGFGSPVAACAFWTEETWGHHCTIIVEKRTNNDILGHEFRHCIQGHFH